jgi:predicted amidohydrolase YtcJ
MYVACSPGIAALARSVLGNLASPSFAPAGASVVTGGPAGARAGSERAVILRGGPILTVDDACPAAEALAIRGSRILAVGSATDVKRHFTPDTEILDLEGRAVLPGFVESHVHVLSSALAAAGEVDAVSLFQEDPGRVAELCAATLREFAARGCTTVYDVGIGMLAGVAEHELLGSLARAPDAPVRVHGAFVPQLATELAAKPGGGDERYDVAGIAYWADGPVYDAAAALRDPYLGGGGVGRLNHAQDDLRDALAAWHRAGWQLVVHASGDRAAEQVLRCFEEILDEGRTGAGVPGSSAADAGHRIDGFALADEELFARAAALELSLSHAVDHVYFWGEAMRDSLLGPERAARLYALVSEAEHGICSSCHGGPRVDPLLSVRTAMTRLMRDSDDVLGPFQQLDLAHALATVTHNPARQTRLGDRVGVLRAGMLADLVVLDRDPREVAPERLHELCVLETWLGGRRQRWR